MSRKANSLRRRVAIEVAKNKKLASERQRLKEHLLTVTARIEIEMPDGSSFTIPYAAIRSIEVDAQENRIKAKAIQQHPFVRWPTKPQ